MGEKERINFEQSTQWLSRTIAILLFMVGPGVLGNFADRHWKTQFFTPLGFIVGMLLATTLMIILAKKLIPAGRGQPLSDEEFDGVDQSNEDESLEG